MGTMRNALLDAGLASERQHRETEAAAQLRADMEAARRVRPAKEKSKRLEILRNTSAPEPFRREARRLLLLEPGLVQEVLAIAHTQQMHKKGERGGKRLIADLYQLKEMLAQSGLSNEARISIVDKRFSKR